MLKQANLSFSVTAQAHGNDTNAIQFSTQDKKTAKLIFTIKEGKKPLNLTDIDGEITLVMQDKSRFVGKAEVTKPLDGVLEYTLTQEQIRHAGRAQGEVVLKAVDGSSVGGFRFNFTIKKALVDEDLGPVKEFYIQDLEAVKQDIRKKADATASDINNLKEELETIAGNLEEEYQNKAYTVDEKLADVQATVTDLRENGTGIDAQARQKVEQVNTQLTDIKNVIINLADSEHGVIGDGVHDDTNALQAALDSLKNGGNVISPPGKIYKITKPILSKYSDISIDFGGSKLQYAGTESLGDENGNDRIYGAITIRGSLLTNTRVSITEILPGYKGIIQNLPGLQIDTVTGTNKPTTQSSKLTLDSSSSAFQKGDIVHVFVDNFGKAPGTWSKKYEDNPARMDVVCKVIWVSDNNVWIDVNPDFIFGGANFSGYIEKVSPINNILIKNLEYEDVNETPIPSPVTTTDRNSWVGGIMADICSNVRIENFTSSKHRLPAVAFKRCYRPSLDKLLGLFPRVNSSGCGYGVQVTNSTQGNFVNLRGENLRHLIDFSGSGHMYVNNARMPISYMSAFDCHGIGEFDITFDTCRGQVIIGNDVNFFPQMTGKVKFINFEGNIHCNWARELICENSDVTFLQSRMNNRTPRLVMTNTKIKGYQIKNNILATTRGAYTDNSYLIWDKCSVEIENINDEQGLSNICNIVGYHTVKITGSPYIINRLPEPKTFSIYRCNNVEISNNSGVENIDILLSNWTSVSDESVSGVRMEKGSLRVQNNNFVENKGVTAVNFINFSPSLANGDYIIFNTGNSYRASITSRWMRIGSEVTQKITVISDNNYIGENTTSAFVGTAPYILKGENRVVSELVTDLDHPTAYLDIAANATSQTVVFPGNKRPKSTDYSIVILPEWNTGGYWISGKTTNGFTVNWNNPPSSATKLKYKVEKEYDKPAGYTFM